MAPVLYLGLKLTIQQHVIKSQIHLFIRRTTVLITGFFFSFVVPLEILFFEHTQLAFNSNRIFVSVTLRFVAEI
jgi:hypothetical protein